MDGKLNCSTSHPSCGGCGLKFDSAFGIVKICGVEKSPKIEKAEAFASVSRSEGRSPERRETDAARVAARRTQCVAGQAMVIMFAFAHSLYGTGGIPPGLNDVILILL